MKNPIYVAQLTAKLLADELDPRLEAMLRKHAYGKSKETVDVNATVQSSLQEEFKQKALNLGSLTTALAEIDAILDGNASQACLRNRCDVHV